jgi:Na+-transporting NADH:ubiquinone oxidoreductase subunit C
MSRETPIRTFKVAFVLCVLCSLVVSAAAVLMRPMQEKNKLAYQRVNILKAAGLYEEGKPVDEQFKAIETTLIDLATGLPVEKSVVDPATYDPRKAAGSATLSTEIDPALDAAGIKHREKYAFVYTLKNGDQLEKVILPIYGKGLWSTMYGYIALEKDLRTVAGITFYQHGETPGLGGEIENAKWQASWIGKDAFVEEGDSLVPAIKVVKGGVVAGSPNVIHSVDGLSGASITSAGVQGTIAYWLGADAFGHYLRRLRKQQGDGNG